MKAFENLSRPFLKSLYLFQEKGYHFVSSLSHNLFDLRDRCGEKAHCQFKNLSRLFLNLFDTSLTTLFPRRRYHVIEDLSLYGKEFTLQGGSKACLLIHGLGCGPIQMRELAEGLAQQGFTARGILLPGHCSTLRAFEEASWRDWEEKVEGEYLALRKDYKNISVVGFSVGGLLALRLGAKYPLDRLVSLGAPMFVIREYFPFKKLLCVTEKLFSKIKTVRKKWFIDMGGVSGFLRFPTVSHYPIATIKTLGELIRTTKRDLERIKSPLLVVHSRKDLVAAPFSAFYITHFAGSQEKKLVWLNRSDHVMMFDNEKAFLFDAVKEFLGARKEACRPQAKPLPHLAVEGVPIA